MNLRFYINMLSHVSRTVASGIFIVGMMLIGFGFMIYLLPKFFAMLAALVFCVSGAGCLITAVKIFWAQKKMSQFENGQPQSYRENVQVHIKDPHEMQ